MADTFTLKARHFGKTEQARQTALHAALEKHQAAIAKHRETLHPIDLKTEPANFFFWTQTCDFTATCAELEDFLRTARSAIESARLGADSNPRQARYVDLRTPYIEYAEHALARRFPTRGAKDPQPYGRDESGYVAQTVRTEVDHG